MRITNFEIVVAFEPDQAIVLSCGPYLKDLQKKFGGRLLTINAPDDAPPQLPRVVLKLEDTILRVCLDRFHITTMPPSHVAQDMEKAAQFALQRSSSIISVLKPSITIYEWTGIIVELEFPQEPLVSKSALEAAAPIFDHLINIDRKHRELASFQLQFGIRDDSYFVTYTLSAYESRKIAITLPRKTRFISVDLNEYPLIDCGIKISLDVNNRPGNRGEEPNKDIELILKKQLDVFNNLTSDLNLGGILT